MLGPADKYSLLVTHSGKPGVWLFNPEAGYQLLVPHQPTVVLDRADFQLEPTDQGALQTCICCYHKVRCALLFLYS